MGSDTAVESVSASAYRVPTDLPEADGTLSWTSTTLILVQVRGSGASGLGYTYTDVGATSLINGELARVVTGCDAMDPPRAFEAMRRAVRNFGRRGIAATAISAVDVALWDLKAVLLQRPLARLLGRCRSEVPIYGSGGFTSYDERQLTGQLAGWVEQDGCRWVKMKVGSDPERDPARAAAVKAAIGSATLFVDANGAYTAKQAKALAARFAEQQVRWFEEPVSSDDLAGLHRVREQLPAPMEVAAGEYGYALDDFRRMLEAQAVDVLQADATRCGGVTGFLRAAALAEAFHIDLSAHCAPALHRHLGCAVTHFRHLEWFHDHVRIERLLFDGAPRPRAGVIAPDDTCPGLGLVFKHADAARYAITAAPT